MGEGWRRRDGGALDERQLSDVVMDVLFRGEAYGVVQRIDVEGAARASFASASP